jgi:hypothetical protein
MGWAVVGGSGNSVVVCKNGGVRFWEQNDSHHQQNQIFVLDGHRINEMS